MVKVKRFTRQMVKDLLAMGPLTSAQITRMMKCSPKTAQNLLASMYKDGEVERSNLGSELKSLWLWKLPSDNDDNHKQNI